MRVVINEGHNVLHKGETYGPGSILDLPEEDAKVLIKGEVASRASHTTPEDTGGPDTPGGVEGEAQPEPKPAPRPRRPRGRKRAK